MNIKRHLCLILGIALSIGTFAQNAKTVLDKCAKQLTIKTGASANFSVSGGSEGNTSGTILLKDKKFKVTTPEMTVWFDGKTQWSYMKSTNEVNISTPNESQRMSINPYSFLTLYKSGYNMSMKTLNNGYEVHLKAIHPARSMQEFYVTVSKSYVLQKIKMLQGKQWLTINVSNIKSAKQSDNTFTFNKNQYSSAEIVDLR